MGSTELDTPVVDARHAATFTAHRDFDAAAVQVREAATAYYEGGDLALDDARCGALIVRMLATETARPDWQETDSPTAAVGAGEVHSAPMLSLDNVFHEESLRTWATRLDKVVGQPVTRFCGEPKIGGLAIAAPYLDGTAPGRDPRRRARRRGRDRANRLVSGLPAQLSEPQRGPRGRRDPRWKVVGSVSARTDPLVIGDGVGSTTDKAVDLGISTMSAERFVELLAAHQAGDTASGERPT